MSLLNLHGQLLDLLSKHDLVYSPLMDIKEYPCDVDIALVEGAVANRENQEIAEMIRERTGIVVSLGDCAANCNVSGLRNPLDLGDAMRCCYGEGREPVTGTMELLTRVMPLHQVIRVDAFIAGCPPEPSLIMKKLELFLESA
jgi:NAD-reducing hydrogenase small subunit